MGNNGEVPQPDINVYRIEEYVAEPDKNRVFRLVPIDGDTYEDLPGEKVKYLGSATAVLATDSGPMQVPVEFEIEANTVGEAFRKFKEEGERQKPSILKKIQQSMGGGSRIVTPGQMPPGFDPRGRM